MNNSLEMWEIIQPTPEVIETVKENYNRLIDRMNKAEEFLNRVSNQDLYALEIRFEILEPMGKYIYTLKKWNVTVSDKEIQSGFLINE